MMNIDIGFSPCPNDTFIFDALVNRKIDTGSYMFTPVMEDVQTLNQWAVEGKLPVTKISYGVYPLLAAKYLILNSGSALGSGVGPLLIKKKDAALASIENSTIAIPGEYTTAHMLFSLAYPTAKNKIFLRYDEIENFVIEEKGLGVIIHENRFTYQNKGLEKITDLGNFWEEKTQSPIPLGGIVAAKNLNAATRNDIDLLIKRSIEYAYSQYPTLSDFIRCNAQEMSEDVMRKHIELYVNDFSKNLGVEGKSAVLKMMEIYYNGKAWDKNVFSSEH